MKGMLTSYGIVGCEVMLSASLFCVCMHICIPVQKTENMAVGIRHADHIAPSIRKRWH
jgi:hypothetical protein